MADAVPVVFLNTCGGAKNLRAVFALEYRVALIEMLDG